MEVKEIVRTGRCEFCKHPLSKHEYIEGNAEDMICPECPGDICRV